MSEEFKRYLRSAFHEPTDATVVRAVQEAVGLADDLRRNTPWLGTLVGDDLVGTLRRAAVMWRLHEFCRNGELPFAAHEVSNTNGTSHLLSIRSFGFEAHVVRTDSPGAFPKDAPIRQDMRLSNNGDLFEDPKIVPLSEIAGRTHPYAWLSFNANPIGALSHVCWCMPERTEKRYLARVNILLAVMRAGSAPVLIEPPKPDAAATLRFKRHVEERIERERGKSDDKMG